MIARVRIALLLLRPAVAVLLVLFATIGLASAKASGRFVPSVVTGVVLAGYLLFSVALNDVADAEIDRINLSGDRRRPMVAGATPQRDLLVIGCVAAAVAVVVAGLVGWSLLALTGVALALSAAYSLRPIRLADRGALAALLLPACYVAVPYCTALCAAHAPLTGRDIVVLGGLYAGFMGRIVLKDFRDVRGDTLFGRRTFLVRHGRRATCAFSAIGWAAGTGLLVSALGGAAINALAFDLTSAANAIGSIALLRRLAVEANLRREQWTISALAILGRGALVTVLLQLELVQRNWSPLALSAVLAAFALLTAAQARLMLRAGPRGHHLSAAALDPEAGETQSLRAKMISI